MTTTIYYASDVHGSNRCFRKFLNAAKFYKAQVLVMGGDVLGKAIIFLEETRPGIYVTQERGQRLELTSEADVREFEKIAADKGMYTYRCREGERDALHASGEVESVFERLMKERLLEWITLADERLAGTGVRCYIMGGNDDPPEVLNVLDTGRFVHNPEGAPVVLDEASEMISLGWSNPTPWNTPRECSEDELAQRIDALMMQVKRPDALVMNLHVPPFKSGLDDAPELNADFKVQSNLGQTRFIPVGSTAVRAAIERYQPLLGLHGHIHEAHASCKIGRTVCINPGSDYSEGVLHGVLATLHKGKLRGYQMVSG
ncbi:MAG: metallophosphoesterase family protein [Ktedonobacteraceae bacterium]